MSTEIKNLNLPHMDAEESIFFARELQAVKAKSYDVKYPELKARRLIPVSEEAGEGAETIKYEQFDQVGMAKIISSYADDLPRADVKGKEFVSVVRGLGSSYGYSLQEIRAAKMAGKPLQQRRADAARRAVEQTLNTIGFKGDANHGLYGLLNHPNISTQVIPADGTGASALWVNKSVDLILRDMNLIANFPVANTKGVEIPDTLLLPLEQYNLIATKRIGVDSNMTVLKYFLETSPYIKAVEWLEELNGFGTGGADVILAYKRDPEKLTFEIPMDFVAHDPQAKGLEYQIPCEARTGGVIVYYPLSICKGEGI